MNKAILLQCEDWEGLYINGKLVKEGHIPFNEGESRTKCFVKLSKEYSFDLLEMKEESLCPADMFNVEDIGSFPEDIKGFVDDYENYKDDRN